MFRKISAQFWGVNSVIFINIFGGKLLAILSQNLPQNSCLLRGKKTLQK
jgi:hypothetical protein